jgi:hypothetical protein
VSINGAHRRDKRELIGRRDRVIYDDSSHCANLIDLEQLNEFAESVLGSPFGIIN